MEDDSFDTIKLISNDNKEFIITKQEAMVSGMLRTLLTGSCNFIENKSNEIRLPTINSNILELICKFFKYTIDSIKDPTIRFPIDEPISYELADAAHFLDC